MHLMYVLGQNKVQITIDQTQFIVSSFIFQNVIALEDVATANLRSENSTRQQIQQQIHNEHIHVPLQATSPSTEEPVSPGSLTSNDDYTPVDMRTLSWEVARDDVEVEKTIGRGAFGQVAKGMGTFYSGLKQQVWLLKW